MALYKFSGFLRGVLHTNRNVIFQQNATIKQSTKEKLKDLNLPEKPKKPLTPYFRFLRDYRQEALQRTPAIKVTDLVRDAAGNWANVHSTVKEKYTCDYKIEMEDYSKQMMVYASKLTTEQKAMMREAKEEKLADKKKRQMKRKLKDNDKPKRPIGPYMHFLLEKSKQGNKKISELMHELKGQWQSLPDIDKIHYNQLFEDDKKRYELEMNVWEKRMISEGNTDIVRQSALQQAQAKPSRLTRFTHPNKPEAAPKKQ